MDMYTCINNSFTLLPVTGPGLSSTSPARISRTDRNKIREIDDFLFFSFDRPRIHPPFSVLLFPTQHGHLQQFHRPILALH